MRGLITKRQAESITAILVRMFTEQPDLTQKAAAAKLIELDIFYNCKHLIKQAQQISKQNKKQ